MACTRAIFSIATTGSEVLVYVDSSALLKRVLDEEHRDALDEAMVEWSSSGAIFASSLLAEIEVFRALRSRLDRGLDPAAFAAASDHALDGIRRHPIDPDVVALARIVGPPTLRSLDAIHLATALQLGTDLLLAYDERLLAAANELGIRTSSPI